MNTPDDPIPAAADAPRPTMPPAAATPVAASPRGAGWRTWLLLAIVLGTAAWVGYTVRAQQQRIDAELQRIQALESRLDALRNDARAQAARLLQSEASQRTVRDELLGYGQRAALIEDNLQQLAERSASAGKALRLDEAELLLAQGQQRLLLAGDLAGCLRAYALAGQLLESLADPSLVNLRQTLLQERAALEAIGQEPRQHAARELAAFAAQLPALPDVAEDDPARPLPWWRRALSQLIQVRPTDSGIAVEAADRAAGLAALRLDLTLAHAAIERGDGDGYRAALARADLWLQRLWPDSAPRRAQRRQLAALAALPLAVDIELLGSTLGQLRQQRLR